MDTIAAQIGISARHLRRIFEAQWGISPLQYLQTRRLLTAKQLLTDTQLPMAHIATLSGFSSLRRFNACFAEHYRMEPRALRKHGRGDTAAPLMLKAAYRPPYDVTAMLSFFEQRAITGVEAVDPQRHTLARTLAVSSGDSIHLGWVQIQFIGGQCAITLRVSDSLANVLPEVLMRVRDMLDLDAGPLAINQLLDPHFPGTEGLRVPGTIDGFELAVRAILGQQVTVRAAQTLTNRLVQRFGVTLPTPLAGLSHLFPSPHTLASASADALGQIGIVRQRQRAIVALAQAVHGGELSLHAGAPFEATVAALEALPGIGPWTAQYIAMRALRWPDAFPAGDVALQTALGVRNAAHPAQAAEAASLQWKPWRSYAVLRAWAGSNVAIK
jgi:AraC family transcriptional regulator of adaptative response / DNA-3-methyladenine glycosylase II